MNMKLKAINWSCAINWTLLRLLLCAAWRALQYIQVYILVNKLCATCTSLYNSTGTCVQRTVHSTVVLPYISRQKELSGFQVIPQTPKNSNENALRTSFVPQTSIHLITALSHIFCVPRSHNIFCKAAGLLPYRPKTSPSIPLFPAHAPPHSGKLEHMRNGSAHGHAASAPARGAPKQPPAHLVLPLYFGWEYVCVRCVVSALGIDSMNSLIVTYEHKSKEPEKT